MIAQISEVNMDAEASVYYMKECPPKKPRQPAERYYQKGNNCIILYGIK